MRTLIIVVTVWAVVCALVPPTVREIRAARLRKPLELIGGPGSVAAWGTAWGNARPLTDEERRQLFFPPPEEESWFSDLFR
jgi:hypothetical protein